MPNFSRNQLIAASIIVAIALIGTGALVWRSSVHNQRSDIKLIQPNMSPGEQIPSGDSAEAPQPEPQKLCVHIAGKVKSPGVYELDPGSRVQDAIKAAGGAVGNADLESINLAEKLTDSQQVYIAPKGKIPPPVVSVVRGGAAFSKTKAASVSSENKQADTGPVKLSTPGQGTVNINSAGLDDLQRLPGVGPSTAQSIIDYRTQNGRFESVDELDEVKGIGPSKLAKVRPFISL